MFDVGASEVLLIVIVAIIVIGPRELPTALRTAGRWIGQIRRVSGHFRAGIDAMIREAEMEETERKWREQNARIMAEHPDTPDLGEHEMTPLPKPEAEARAAPPPEAAADDDEPQLPLPKRPPR